MVYLEKRLEMFSCIIYLIKFVMYYVMLKLEKGYMCSINMIYDDSNRLFEKFCIHFCSLGDIETFQFFLNVTCPFNYIKVVNGECNVRSCYVHDVFLDTISVVLSARRRKVRERQQKLMAEFASKQKEFMENVLVDEDGE